MPDESRERKLPDERTYEELSFHFPYYVIL